MMEENISEPRIAAFGPIRSALFVPGSRSDRIDKALATDADVVVIDLEDAVALDEKETARSKSRKAILANPGKRLVIRVNGSESEFLHDDLSAVVVEGLQCIMVPKVESPEDLESVYKLILEIEKERQIAPGSVIVIALIESAAGIENAFDIVSDPVVRSRLYSLAFGAADYTLDMGMEITYEGVELLYPRSRLAVACRAANTEPPLDTPFMLNLKDMVKLADDAKRAKALGFQGKLCIHPNQIEIVNNMFSPTTSEITYAKRVMEAFKEAENKGLAAIQMDGRFIDYPVVERCRRILRKELSGK